MKITFVLPHAGLSGGIRVVAIYAARLKKRGHQVIVVSVPRQPLTFKQKLKYLIREKKWPIQENGTSHFDGVDVEHKILEKYRPITNEDLPDGDIVIATFWVTSEWVSKLAESKGKKVYFVQGKEADFPDLPKQRIRETYFLPLNIITISQSLKEWIEKISKREDVTLIFNSVDTEQFRSNLRSKHKKPSVGMLYSALFIKGCDVSLKAIAIAREYFPDIKLIAFGMDAIDQNLQLPENSEYYQQPEQSKIAELYSMCDVWVCGSRMEGFHLPPLEAMACRCPVVSTAVGGPIDIIQDGINGYIVPVDDYQKLAEAIIKVLSLTSEDWMEMSERAYQTAHFYSWDDATYLFEKKLLEIIAS